MARDYLRDRAAYLGNSRLGPDLANVGLRHDKADWYYEHMYQPETVIARHELPADALPFRQRKIVGQPSAEARPR